MLAIGAFPSDLQVTHELPLVAIRESVETALARDRGAIKVLLQPQEGS